VDRLWRGGGTAVETVNTVYSPMETLKILAPNQRIATSEQELRELIAGCDATRTLVVEDPHPHDSQQVRSGSAALETWWRVHSSMP
jgi:hypothetical protein